MDMSSLLARCYFQLLRYEDASCNPGAIRSRHRNIGKFGSLPVSIIPLDHFANHPTIISFSGLRAQHPAQPYPSSRLPLPKSLLSPLLCRIMNLLSQQGICLQNCLQRVHTVLLYLVTMAMMLGCKHYSFRIEPANLRIVASLTHAAKNMANHLSDSKSCENVCAL